MRSICRSSIVVAIYAACAGISVAATDTAVQKGNAASVNAVSETARLEKLYRKNPSDAAAAYSFAKVAPCSLSVVLFTKIAQDGKASDSLRAKAYDELGDYSFVQNAFKTAAEKYRRAFELQNDERYALKQAQSAAAMNDSVTASPLFMKLSASDNQDIAGMALYGCALIEMKAGRFDSALVKLSRCAAPDTVHPWTIAAAAARLECALRTGKKEIAVEVDKQLQPFGEYLLEKHMIDVARVAKPAGTVSKAAVSKPENGAAQSGGAEFTLQVGAFGTLENATTLQKKLLTDFSDVSILPVTLAENVFYRVRVGSFKSRAAASEFAEDSLLSKKISYKVVEK